MSEISNFSGSNQYRQKIAIIHTFPSVGDIMNIKEYEINLDANYPYDPFKIRAKIRDDYTFSESATLSDNLLVPWRKKWSDLGQDFNPHVLLTNVGIIYTRREDYFGERKVSYFVREFLRAIKENSLIVGENRFIVNRIKYRHHGVLMDAPWCSGLANGKVLSALSVMKAMCAPEDVSEISLLSDQIFGGLSYVSSKPNSEKFWTTITDDLGYLWFEEYPRPGHTQSHVLNGHISGVIGVFNYYKMSRDSRALDFLRASIYTVESYLPSYRVVGSVNRYDLISDVPDYGPKRTVLQIKSLFHMTNDKIFEKYFREFSSDMAEHCSGVSL